MENLSLLQRPVISESLDTQPCFLLSLVFDVNWQGSLLGRLLSQLFDALQEDGILFLKPCQVCFHVDASELPSKRPLQNAWSSKHGGHSLSHLMQSLPPSLRAWLPYTCAFSQRQIAVPVMLLFSTTFLPISLPYHFSGYRSCFFMGVPCRSSKGELLITSFCHCDTVFSWPFTLPNCPVIMHYLPVNIDLIL